MKKLLTTITLSLTLIFTTSSVTPAMAANGDFYDNLNKKAYNAADYRTNPTTFNALLSALDARPNNLVFENGGKGYNYNKMLTAITNGTNAGKTVAASFVAAKADPANADVLPSSIVALKITAVGTWNPILGSTKITVNDSSLVKKAYDGDTELNTPLVNDATHVTVLNDRAISNLSLAGADGIKIVAPTPTVIISSIANITQTINQRDSYSLPSTVEVRMSDSSNKQAVVTWNPSTVDTSKAGTQMFSGSVLGYSGQVKLTLTINAIAPTNIAKIGAPIGTYLCPDGLGFNRNSVDGIKVYWMAKNQTGKTINYYTANISMYNAVGDPAYDEIKRTSKIPVKYVGPVLSGDDLAIYHIIAYSAVCEKIVIDSIYLQYSDGTSETILYGRSGTETLK